jgi:hypothetical protein
MPNLPNPILQLHYEMVAPGYGIQSILVLLTTKELY